MINSLVLRVTEKCNLRCKYCYAQRGHQGSMCFSTAKTAIDRFLTGPKNSIQFTGGEPLLEIDLIEKIVHYLHAKQNKQANHGEQGRTRFSIQTNGTLLDSSMVKRLKTLNIGVGVSLDGAEEGNRLRLYPDGSPSFSKVIEGIRCLREQGMFCNVNGVLTSANQSSLVDLAHLCAYLGNVKGLGFDVLRPIGSGAHCGYQVDEDKLKKEIPIFIEEVKKLKGLGVDLSIREVAKVRRKLEQQLFPIHYCNAQSGCSLTVDYLGNVYPCSSLVDETHLLGNIQGEIKEKTGLEPPAKCLACSEYNLCRGGCPASKEEADCVMHKLWIKGAKDEIPMCN